MKQQKMVSLDEATALIASDMNNFSKWVRDTLHAQSMGIDIAESERVKARWVGVARHLAATLIDYSKAIDPNYEKTVDQILYDALQQTKIEEF